MAILEEEQRAAAYRASLQRRQESERQRALALRGDDAEAEAVRDAWQPVLDYLADRRPTHGQEGHGQDAS